MRFRLTVLRGGGHVDVETVIDSGLTVGALAAAIDRRDPANAQRPAVPNPTLSTHTSAGVTALRADTTVITSGLRSGSVVSVTAGPASTGGLAPSPVVATVVVADGPDIGRSFELRAGNNMVGRAAGCEIRLSDPMVSKAHARISAGALIEVVDERSSNGVWVGGQQVARATVGADEPIVIGETTLVITRLVQAVGESVAPTIAFNRSPRLDPVHEGEEFLAPEPPRPPTPPRLPFIMLLAPLLMGGVMVAITRNILTVTFLAFSPIMMLGSYFENRRAGRRAYETAVDQFRAELAELVVELQAAAERERVGRRAEHPTLTEVIDGAMQLTPLLWTRRPEHESFGRVCLGMGRQPSRTEVQLPSARNTVKGLWGELNDAVGRFADVDGVPVTATLATCGSIGVGGPDGPARDVARGLVAQVVGLHSPAELTVCAVASAGSCADWEWLKWLPHTGSDHSPLSSPHLASRTPDCLTIVSELEDLLDRTLGEQEADERPSHLILLVVEDDAPVERSRLVSLLERGPAAGVHVLWVAPSVQQLPAACRVYVDVGQVVGTAVAGNVTMGEEVRPIDVARLDRSTAELVARRLSPVVDAGVGVDSESDIPVAVSFLAESGPAIAEDPGAVLERWSGSNSLPIPPDQVGVKLKRENGLRALVGRSATDVLHLDLRTQGPHALVGGTTGAGKSEFLQTWVLGMAAANSPLRVAFLFIDYKGGSAFADCVHLPHSVGLVTDLSPHLVHRALTSLNAELRHREHLLNRKKAKDLLELERRRDPDAPPSLVIVVDEFAALVAEVPEFVDGVVNVAQRGRSLGLHLILATQRPAGVIRDNLRANTNLRVALRMADADDSTDVVGTPLAAGFDPALPGRAIAKTGPGRLTSFQTGYVGGWTSGAPPEPQLHIETVSFAPTEVWAPVEDPAAVAVESDLGPPDIQRVVTTIQAAATAAGIAPPRKPWLPELAAVYDLATLPLPRRDAELVYGVIDRPAAQEQGTVAFRPDLDGNMVVFGAGGSGKSTFLRSIAVSAGLTARGGPCYVYGLDFGARGLTMLESLPHVGAVIGADDTERTLRLLAELREAVNERAVRYAAVNASTIEEYRRLAGVEDEPRILLLIDGFAAFRAAYEVGGSARVFEHVVAIAADGRPVGVHVVVSADRVGAVPTSLASSLQRRLALRLSSETDEAFLRVPRGGFVGETPPGRGFLDGMEVQVGVFGGSADATEQAAAIDRLAASMARAGGRQAPPIGRLPERVELAELPATVGGEPVFGLEDATLGPVGFEPEGMFLIAGPSGSGRTTALLSILTSLCRVRPETEVVYLGRRRSPLASMTWARSAIGVPEVAALATDLAAEWGNGDAEVAGRVVVLDGLGDLINSEADYPVQELLKVCRANGVFVIGDGETSDVQGGWPLLTALKASRRGLILQPDQSDGDALLRTSFPRIARADFPVGRGMYVRNGKVARVQVALP